MDEIMIFCAHSDDQIFGVGGTAAKYSKNKKITAVIFSFGEMTHPWLKRKFSIEMRVKESHEAAKLVGIEETLFLGLEETKFAKEIKEKNIKAALKRMIKKKRPSKIFTHSIDDPHIDHRDVYKVVKEVITEMKCKCELYSFDIWNPINFRKRDSPQLYVDISETFSTKIKALQCFKSQKIALFVLLWTVYLRAIVYGFHNKTRFAERFIKVELDN